MPHRVKSRAGNFSAAIEASGIVHVAVIVFAQICFVKLVDPICEETAFVLLEAEIG